MNTNTFRMHLLPVALLALVSLALFANTLSSPFIWEDKDLIQDHRYIKDPGKIPFLFTPLYWNHYSPSSKGQYRPLRAVTFALDYRFWKLNPFGYHLTNIIVHTANVILVYFLLFLMVSSNSKTSDDDMAPRRRFIGIPFLGALFFAAHPIHTESVTWIKNRSDLLTLFFFLASLIFFIRYTLKQNLRSQTMHYLCAMVCFILALFSKEMAISLPVIAVVYMLYFSKKGLRKVALGTIPFFLVALLYLAFKAILLKTIVSAETPVVLSFYIHVLTVFKTIGYYLLLLLAPYKLSAERVLTSPDSFRDPAVLLSAAAIILVGILIVKTFRNSRLVSFSGLWILITIIPVSNIIYITGRPIAEQRLYLPSFGFCLFLAVCVRSLGSLQAGRFSRKTAVNCALLLLSVLFISYAFTTVLRNRDWSDQVTFWSKTVKASPKSARAYNNLGKSFSDIGREAEAMDAYKKAVELNPDYPHALHNLGLSYCGLGKLREAAALFKKAIAIDPSYSAAHTNLGNLYYQTGNVKEAVDEYKKAIAADSYYGGAYYNLSVVCLGAGETQKAIDLFKRTIELDPNNADAYYNLGIAYYKAGKVQEAIDAYIKAIEINPQLVKAYNNLGGMYVAAGNDTEAIPLFEKAIELDPQYAKAYNSLGVLYASRGMTQEATDILEMALIIDPTYFPIHFNLATIYYNAGRFDLAIEHCDKAIELGAQVDPGFLELLKPHRR